MDNGDLEFIREAYKVFMYDFFDEKDQRRYIVYEKCNNQEEVDSHIRRAEMRDCNYTVLEWDDPILWNDRDVIRTWKITGKNGRVEIDPDMLKTQVLTEIDKKDQRDKKWLAERYVLAQVEEDTTKQNEIKATLGTIGQQYQTVEASNSVSEILTNYRQHKKSTIS